VQTVDAERLNGAWNFSANEAKSANEAESDNKEWNANTGEMDR
jgi:hypothetical protein